MSMMVTGATGQLGSLIIDLLLQFVPAGQIIACVRDREKANDLLEKGVEIRFGDWLHYTLGTSANLRRYYPS
ncbi:SDR family oxidoreductase [Paenibacillus sp. VTT E-133291]|nr:SDR family oxidoreductase [Paenibacillus sp. VTT E-133291]